jgi:hypothetical protein
MGVYETLNKICGILALSVAGIQLLTGGLIAGLELAGVGSERMLLGITSVILRAIDAR